MGLRIALIALAAATLTLGGAAHAGTLFPGYDRLGWNTDVEQVMKRYPRGQVARLGDEIIYRQQRPTSAIASRSFSFRDGGLRMVSVAFDRGYVAKLGIEHLLAAQVKLFGVGTMDRTQAPHLLNYVWEGNGTRITFGYVPKRPDMTVIVHERRENGDIAISP